MTTEENRPCNGCGAEPGERHRDWDDIARCRYTGTQLIQCGWHPDDDDEVEEDEKQDYDKAHPRGVCEPDIWDGEYPGVKAARELGWYTAPDSLWGETEDLNRLYSRATWNPETERLEVEDRN